MARIRFSSASGEGVNMEYNDFLYGRQLYASEKTLRFTDGESTITYRGTFTARNGMIYGDLDSIDESWKGATIYTATNLEKNANTIWRYAYFDNDAAALRYMLSGHDTITGTRLSDLLKGGSGDDVVNGGRGNDRLYGESGADTLIGGPGRDVMTGGWGADDFVFRSAAESLRGSRNDVITDFSRRQGDKIDLSAFDANENRRGAQEFDYIGSREWSGRAGELRIDDGLLTGDTDGDGRADFALTLTGLSYVRESDLIL